MHGGDYAWILPGDTIDPPRTEDEKWHSGQEECTPSQLSQAQNGLFIVRSLGSALGNEMSSSGLVSVYFSNLSSSLATGESFVFRIGEMSNFHPRKFSSSTDTHTHTEPVIYR